MQADAGPHRVAEVVGRAPHVAEAGPPRRQVGPHPRRATVTGQVDEHQLVIGGQVVGQATPHAAGLGEPVGQHQAGSVAPGDGVQRGCGHRRWL